MTPKSLQVCLHHHHWYLEQIVHPWSNWPWLTSLKSDFEPRYVYAWFSEPGVLHKPWTSWTTDHECQLRNGWAKCNSKVTIPKHGVWKSQKKSHLSLRAKRATFTFLSGQKFIKNGPFSEFLKTWSLRSNSVTRQVNFNRAKNGGKCQNWKTQVRNCGVGDF